MTTTALRAAAAALGLALAGGLPLAAGAATSSTAGTQTYVLNAVSTQPYRAGEYDGRMRLTIAPNGIVQGTYRDLTEGLSKTVTGGLEPNGQIWLEIGGTLRSQRFLGTFRDGVLHTVIQAGTDGDPLHLDATPAR